MKRAKHSLSYYKLLTCDMGELIPCGLVDAIPGDTFQQSTSLLVRMSPLAKPVMHPIVVRWHHWFVPYRLLWTGTNGKAFEEFITGGNDGEGGDSGAFPVITAGGGGFAAKGLLDYMGVPPSVGGLSVSALWPRAYNLIFNENYRDQDLVAARALSLASGTDSTTALTVAKVAWEKDSFTSARPNPQRGPEVTLPLGSSAPVELSAALNVGPTIRRADNHNLLLNSAALGSNVTTGNLNDVASGVNVALDPNSTLIANLSAATAVSVNDVREAFAMQRWQEARAQFGARYTEYLRYIGVTPADSRLDRPEYLGGGKQVLSITEVLQTGPDSGDENVGQLFGHGITAGRSRRFRFFVPEHGVIMTVMSVRPRTMYGNSLERFWSKRTKEEFFQKELELIGQQEVYRREVYAQSDANGGNTVFGYQDRYYEYKHHQSLVTGEFRDSSMNDWHLAQLFGSAPALNSDFVTCDPSKRIFQEQSANSLWVYVSNSIQARRPVGRRSIGRIM